MGRDLAGFSADELCEHRRRMGVLFQHGALFTDLSVFDNIAFPMRELTRLPEAVIRDLVLLKLNAVGLRGVENLMPSELSGGCRAASRLPARLRSTLKLCCTTSRLPTSIRFPGRDCPLDQPRQQGFAFDQYYGNARH